MPLSLPWQCPKLGPSALNYSSSSCYQISNFLNHPQTSPSIALLFLRNNWGEIYWWIFGARWIKAGWAFPKLGFWQWQEGEAGTLGSWTRLHGLLPLSMSLSFSSSYLWKRINITSERYPRDRIHYFFIPSFNCSSFSLGLS